MSDLPLPENTPLWAVIMHQSQRDGFKHVHDRLDDLDDKVDPIVIWQARHDVREEEGNRRHNRIAAAVGGIGTLIGAIVTAVVTNYGK